MALRRFGILVLVGACAGEGDVTINTVEQTTTTCVDLPAVADATIANPPMWENFGSRPVLRVGIWKTLEALLRFDLGSIPSTAVIDSAAMELYVSQGLWQTVRVHRVKSSWSESTVTYRNFAQRFDPDVAGTLIAAPNVRKSVDLTALVTS